MYGALRRPSRLMGVNRNVDELAFLKLIHGQKGV
jgi:hypothetical protein